MTLRSTFLGGILAAAMLLAPVAAIVPAQAQMPTVTLTADSVQAFIASFPAVKQTSRELSAKYGDQGGGGNDPTAAFAAWLAYGDAMSNLDGIVKAHGFDNFTSWLSVLQSVVMAYAFAKDGGQMDTDMAQALAAIQNNPNMPEAQKQMMIQQLQGASASMAAVKPPQENIDAVAPYVAELKVVFDD